MYRHQLFLPAILLLSSPLAAAHFIEATAEAGIVFRYTSGASPQRYLPETMGSGAAFFDADNDGWLDLFIVNGAPLGGDPGSEPPVDALYHNEGNGRFTEATALAGVGDPGYGMGCAVADCDNDGDQDLYITHFGPNRLFQNQGDGTFADFTSQAGVGDPGWGAGAAFADCDLDGDLDLYVANYLDFKLEDNKVCLQAGVPAYCPPTAYPGQSGVFYRNEGDGRFADLTRQAGLHTAEGRQLGAVFADYDLDGDPDLFIANDKTPNFLFQNQGNGRFSEIGVMAGVAYGSDGAAESAMGADWGDYDNDGYPDIAVATFQWVANALYHNDGDGFFSYVSYEAGVGAESLPYLGMAIAFLDYDNDGLLDLFAANGHLDKNVREYDSAARYAQKNQLFRNAGAGRFIEVTDSAGPGLEVERVSHGAAFGDYDNDGDVDIFVSDSDAPRCTLLRNEGGANHYLTIETIGAVSNRDGSGARLTVQAGELVQTREVRANYGYLGSSDRRAHFGLGARRLAERVEIRWPSGAVQVLENVPADQFLTVREAAP